MDSTHTAATVEEGASTRQKSTFDYPYLPEVDAHTPAEVPVHKDALALVLKAQAGIQGLLAVMVGADCGDEELSGLTRGRLYMAVEAMAEFSYAELTRAVKAAEAAVPRH